MVARLDAPPDARAGAALTPAIPGADAAPLRSYHYEVLTDARKRARRVFRAASAATFSGWTTALFALITVAFGVTDPVSLILGAGMGAVAFNEFLGAAMLRRFDVRATARLAIGQLVFGGLILGYSVWSMAGAFHVAARGGSGDAQVDAMLADMNVDGMVRAITIAVYAGVGVVGVIVPGLTALYYRTRARHVRAFLGGTPEWAVRALRA